MMGVTQGSMLRPLLFCNYPYMGLLRLQARCPSCHTRSLRVPPDINSNEEFGRMMQFGQPLHSDFSEQIIEQNVVILMLLVLVVMLKSFK